jgi:predicted nucleic acid-binding protein
LRFADTSFWVALNLRRDERHAAARQLWEARAGAIVTSNHVAGETWTFLRRRAGHGAARSFVDALSASPSVALRHIGERVEAEAWDWLARHDERPYSFVDATSFALMRQLRIREALAFDGDFSAAGFVELRP